MENRRDEWTDEWMDGMERRCDGRMIVNFAEKKFHAKLRV